MLVYVVVVRAVVLFVVFVFVSVASASARRRRYVEAKFEVDRRYVHGDGNF